jgi:hypothetical protein
MTSTKLASLNSGTKISVAQEYPSLSVCGSFDHLQPQSGPLYSVGDRMVIEIYDYALSSKKILKFYQ